MQDARLFAALTLFLYASALKFIAEASECMLEHLLVTKGGISRIVTLPLLIAASAIGKITSAVSAPSAEKQISLSLHRPQKFFATSFASLSGEHSEEFSANFSRFFDIS